MRLILLAQLYHSAESHWPVRRGVSRDEKQNCLDSLSLPRYMEQEHAENIQQVGNQVKSRIEATADRRIESHLVIGR